MATLAVNVDHIATLRQARGVAYPDPVAAAALAELAGADGIVVHLREDRRHIQDRDVRILRETVKTKLILEMAATPEMIDIALKIKPDLVTLVPEKREELTTEGGLDLLANRDHVAEAVATLRQGGIPTSIFIDPNPEQIEAAQANVDALQAQRDAAQAQLDLLLSGATAADKATIQANVAQAQVTLDRARLALEKATLRAPIDGLVVRVDVEPGELIGPQMPVITLLDDTRFKIKVDVDEADIGWVDVNQEVQLTLDAFPAAKLSGRVVAIAPLATLETGVVSYQVTIEIDPIDLPLRSGMTVSADIVIDQRQDILLVPNRAIWIDADTGQPFVEKMVDGEYVGAIIEQGLANEEVSEVLSGLVEGDQLVVRSSSIRDRFRDMMTRSMTGE